MAKSQLLLLSFALLACFSHAYSSIREIPIEKDDQGLYVRTDVLPSAGSFTKGKFLLGLSHSEIIIANWCVFFNIHHCTDFNDYNSCQYREGDPDTTVQHHMFSAKGNDYNLPMYVNNTFWRHEKKTILTTSCESASSLYGHSRTGVLGMAATTKWDYRTFSIFLNRDLTAGGKLLFDTDYSLIGSDPLTFSANSTWQVEINNGTFSLGSSRVPIRGNLMFDPTADTIALPKNLYAYFMSWFKRTHNVNCWGGRGEYKDICYYSGDVKKLQPMILTINGQSIEIPGHIYAKPNRRRGEIELNVRASDPSLHTDCNVSPAFKDSIILDSNVMSHYYSVFTQYRDQHTVELYLANHYELDRPVPVSVSAVLILTVLALLIIAIVLAYKFA